MGAFLGILGGAMALLLLKPKGKNAAAANPLKIGEWTSTVPTVAPLPSPAPEPQVTPVLEPVVAILTAPPVPTADQAQIDQAIAAEIDRDAFAFLEVQAELDAANQAQIDQEIAAEIDRDPVAFLESQAVLDAANQAQIDQEIAAEIDRDPVAFLESQAVLDAANQVKIDQEIAAEIDQDVFAFLESQAELLGGVTQNVVGLGIPFLSVAGAARDLLAVAWSAKNEGNGNVLVNVRASVAGKTGQGSPVNLAPGQMVEMFGFNLLTGRLAGGSHVVTVDILADNKVADSIDQIVVVQTYFGEGWTGEQILLSVFGRMYRKQLTRAQATDLYEEWYAGRRKVGPRTLAENYVSQILDQLGLDFYRFTIEPKYICDPKWNPGFLVQYPEHDCFGSDADRIF